MRLRPFALGSTVALICLLVGIYLGRSRGIPLVAKKTIWSIGVLEGPSPLHLSDPKTVTNPVLTAADVSDVRADFVADPFVVRADSVLHMFFEVMRAGGHGDIGWATSQDGHRWSYQQIVLNEPFHLSYPHVFRWDGTYYMIPAATHSETTLLYEAVDFPHTWARADTLMLEELSDPTLFREQSRWWLFASRGSHTLQLFYADSLRGSWQEHPESPLYVGNRYKARPAGRILRYNGDLYRISQRTTPRYGVSVSAHRIVQLDTRTYQESPYTRNPLFGADDTGWNATGMHQMDAYRWNGRWHAVVDGRSKQTLWGLSH